MTLLKFSRAFWETAVKYKGCKATILRDYDVLKALKDGHSQAQTSIKLGIELRTLKNIVRRYK